MLYIEDLLLEEVFVLFVNFSVAWAEHSKQTALVKDIVEACCTLYVSQGGEMVGFIMLLLMMLI